MLAGGTLRDEMCVLLAVLQLLSSACYAQSTTVEHNFHIVHNVDNRSPNIDPLWYVGRGVRPIGRFGKRHSDNTLVAGGKGRQPVVSIVELLLTTLRDKEEETQDKRLHEGERHWRP